MLYKYRLASLSDVIDPGTGRRMVEAVIDVEETAETGQEYPVDRSITVSWPAYSDQHHVASVDYANKLGGRLNHAVAKDVSSEIKKFIPLIKKSAI